jgi:hypothetical protein
MTHFLKTAPTRKEARNPSDAGLTEADPRATARQASDTWVRIAFVIAPIIGQRAATTLFEQSVQLCSESHPWMKGASQGFGPLMNLTALERSLGEQTARTAVAGAGLLLSTFQDLLGSIVGNSLSRQLTALS